jgi:replicative DNA helicase
MALRTAAAGSPVALFSGEMDQDRLMERALAIEGRASIDELRAGGLSESKRAALGAAALRIRDLPLTIHPVIGSAFDETFARAWPQQPALVVVDYLQTLTPKTARQTYDEDAAASIRALKALALERDVVCFVVSQLPRHRAERPDPRPAFDDFGALGAVKQHADVILGLYREGMYKPDGSVEGATELVLVKNRNGPTGFIDLYFYESWMRFEDMLDPDT